MNKKGVKWLHSEIPGLVQNGILSDETAHRLREYYGSVEGQGKRWATVVFAILGSLLIGAGIILLLAHNWSELSRMERAVVAFVPLILAQVLAGLHLLKFPDSAAWREGTGIFLTMTLMAAVAIVGQTYNVGGTFENYLFTCMLLILPAVYLLQARLPAAIYLAGITTWSFSMFNEHHPVLGFWPMFLLVVPFLIVRFRHDRFEAATSWVFWVAAICLSLGISVSLVRSLPGLWIPIFACLFSVMFLAGTIWFEKAANVWQNPLRVIGAVGVAIFSMVLTFEFPWEDIGWHHAHAFPSDRAFMAFFDYGVTLLLPVLLAFLLAATVSRKRWSALAYGIMPVFAFVGYLLVSGVDNPFSGMLLFNLYLFATGLVILIQGVREIKISWVNEGLFLLAVVIVLRFFDSELGFVLRGLTFILIGVGFLVANLVMLKRKKVKA